MEHECKLEDSAISGDSKTVAVIEDTSNDYYVSLYIDKGKVEGHQGLWRGAFGDDFLIYRYKVWLFDNNNIAIIKDATGTFLHENVDDADAENVFRFYSIYVAYDMLKAILDIAEVDLRDDTVYYNAYISGKNDLPCIRIAIKEV